MDTQQRKIHKSQQAIYHAILSFDTVIDSPKTGKTVEVQRRQVEHIKVRAHQNKTNPSMRGATIC